MALKLTEKLKGIEIPKVAMPNVFGKKTSEDNLDNEEIQENDSDLVVVDSKEVQQAEDLASSTHELQEKVTQFLAENSEKLKKWFSDNQINEKITKVAKKAGATIIYPVLLLYNLFKSPQTSAKDKMLIVAPLAYFVMPADLIPDVIPALGFADDSLAIITSIKTLAASITTEIQEQTKALCENLLGEIDESVISKISNVVAEKQDEIIDMAVKASKDKKK